MSGRTPKPKGPGCACCAKPQKFDRHAKGYKLLAVHRGGNRADRRERGQRNAKPPHAARLTPASLYTHTVFVRYGQRARFADRVQIEAKP